MPIAYCSNCSNPYPTDGMPYKCQVCGSHYNLPRQFDFPEEKIFAPDRSRQGIWRYRFTFNLPENALDITLGEGDTPLIWEKLHEHRVAFKLEYLNPTGSFKDRGMAVLISLLKSRGIETAVEDSSGNAGASFSAYAARAGIKARVFVPDYASGPKKRQIEACGAEVVRIMGPRSNAADAVRKVADEGAIYASHANMPFGMAGYATIAYEIFHQLGGAPGTVITPVGQGGLLLGIGRGFEVLKSADLIQNIPQFIGVQARACAPLWAVFSYGAQGLGWVSEGETIAEGVRIKHPIRGDSVLRLVEQSGGKFIAVDEDEIILGRNQLARLGLYVEPTSAIVWQALEQVIETSPHPVVVILTGTGLKSP